jgi:hypothetical protein
MTLLSKSRLVGYAALLSAGGFLGCGAPAETSDIAEVADVDEPDDDSLSQSEELTQCIARGRTQFDGSSCAASNCGPTAAAMLRYAMTCGAENHTGGEMRTWLNQITDQTGCHGTNLDELSKLMEKVHNKDDGPNYASNTEAYSDMSVATFRDRLDPLKGGWSAIVLGGNNGHAAPCGFTKGHSIYAHRYDAANGRYLVYDPECGDNKARWWDDAALESWSWNRVQTVMGKGKQAYLSNLKLNVVQNGWGPAELDEANGEKAAGDGGPIKLNGVTYSKGLGVHAPSDIRFALPQVQYGYRHFLASIGVDDYSTSAGSVVFRVYVDGVLKYDSGVMTPASATKNIDVAIPLDANELKLVVTDAGNGGTSDHADWGNARVY